MKKICYFNLLILLFSLFACDEKEIEVNKDDVYIEKEPVLVDDNELLTYDELPFLYDNKMTVNGSDAPDPFIMRYNGYYYLYATNGSKYLYGYKSQDLYNWEPVDNGILLPGRVYDYSYDHGGPNASTPYAPEVIYFNGKFYMITSPSGQGHFVLESTSPEGPFEAITDNIGMSIDGHYFIDGKTEKIYLFASGSSGLRGYEMEDDMYTVKMENGRKCETTYLRCSVGGWTEGPYMLQKNGNYYLTYTGTHFLSASYRVNYAFGNKNNEVHKGSTLREQDTILLSTRDDFKGLGHSSTVLGPDMDSYYIAYHNLESSGRRNLNFSRLSFNGANMVADSVKPYNNPGFNAPEFYSYEGEGFEKINDKFLSKTASSDTFTAEFNVTGEGKMIFSYIDENNYSYIEFKNNIITVNKIKNGTLKQVHSVSLIREYLKDVNHTFRLQYRKGKMSLYFDTMEKAYEIDAYFNGGKIGYFIDNTFDEIGYSAYSNVALGSSDSLSYNTQISLANAFDERLSYLTSGSGLEFTGTDESRYIQTESYNLILKNKGNRATYRTYLENEIYSIELRIPAKYAGKKLGLRFDADEIIEITLPNTTSNTYKKGDIIISLGTFDVSEGQHHISIYNIGDEIGFSEIMYTPIYNNELDLTFDSSLKTANYFTKNTISLSEKGFSTNNQEVCGLITKEDYFNFTIESKLTINNISNYGYAGIIFNSTAYSRYPSADADGVNYNYPYRGFLLSFEYNKLSLNYIEFKNHTLLAKTSYTYTPNEEISVKIIQNNNNYIIYVNDEEMFNVNANICSLSGGVGVFASEADVYFKTLNVKTND